MQNKIYQNRNTILYLSVFLIVLGAQITYFYYGIEPWETIGGFLGGFGLGALIIVFSIKKPTINN